MSKPSCVEVGQVWLAGGDTIVVKSIEKDAAICEGGFSSRYSCSAMLVLGGWSCIGLETPHGRVMVGERRWGMGSIATVTAIGGRGVRGTYVSVKLDDGRAFNDRIAELVAQHWPLAAQEPPKPAPEPERCPCPSCKRAGIISNAPAPDPYAAARDRNARVESGPGIASLPVTPARVAAVVYELPERWSRWGSEP